MDLIYHGFCRSRIQSGASHLCSTMSGASAEDEGCGLKSTKCSFLHMSGGWCWRWWRPSCSCLSVAIPTHSLSMWPGLPHNVVGRFQKQTWREREPRESYIAFYNVASVTQCHICHLILGEALIKVYSGSRKRNIDLPSLSMLLPWDVRHVKVTL